MVMVKAADRCIMNSSKTFLLQAESYFRSTQLVVTDLKDLYTWHSSVIEDDKRPVEVLKVSVSE